MWELCVRTLPRFLQKDTPTRDKWNTLLGKDKSKCWCMIKSQHRRMVRSGLYLWGLLPLDPLDSSDTTYSTTWKEYGTVEIIRHKLRHTNCFLPFISTLKFDVYNSHQVLYLDNRATSEAKKVIHREKKGHKCFTTYYTKPPSCCLTPGSSSSPNAAF